MDIRKLSYCLMVGLFLVIFIAPAAFALQIKAGDRFVLDKGDVINDDLIVAGGDIVINGIINGDLIAAGGNIRVLGDVMGDIIIAGGDVDIRGDVGDDAILVSGNIDISGGIGDNLLGASGTFVMGDESSVGRDAFLSAGIVDIGGDVFGNLDVRGSDVVIGGSVFGNVSVESDEAPWMRSGANVGGDVNYVSENDIIIEEGASVAGTVSKTVPVVREVSAVERFGGGLAGFLAIFIVGILLVKMLPVYAKNVSNTLKKSLFISGMWGIVGLIVAPVVAIFLMISVIGLPLGLILFTGYFIGIYIAKVYMSVFLGEYLLSMTGSQSKSLVLMLFIGLLVFEMIGLVPGVGGFVGLLVVIFGFGAILVTKKEMYVNFRKKKLI